ncbi:hypothetical protein MRB53_037035 [Persea americana]|nr:hypothetical protein MRB53_037035 [Persea americana]
MSVSTFCEQGLVSFGIQGDHDHESQQLRAQILLRQQVAAKCRHSDIYLFTNRRPARLDLMSQEYLRKLQQQGRRFAQGGGGDPKGPLGLIAGAIVLAGGYVVASNSLFNEFTAAVEAKQVAQQEAQRAAFVVDKARQEKQAMVVRAQGEARSAELIGEAIKKSRSYIDLREFDNAKSIAGILERSKNKVFLDANVLGLNISQTQEDKNSRRSSGDGGMWNPNSSAGAHELVLLTNVKSLIAA